MQKYADQIFLCSIPDSYLIETDLAFQDGLEQWFQYAKEYNGLDTMYLFDEFQLQTTSPEMPLADSLHIAAGKNALPRFTACSTEGYTVSRLSAFLSSAS